jgi:hypothetical protein
MNNLEETEKKYACNICNYFTSKKSSYDTHILSAKHKLNEENKKKNVKKYYCEYCHFSTSKNNNFYAHLETIKHRIQKNQKNMLLDDIPSKFDDFNHENTNDYRNEHRAEKTCFNIKCDCEKLFKHESRYLKHKQNCSFKIEDTQKIQQITNNVLTNETLIKIIQINNESMKDVVKDIVQNVVHEFAKNPTIQNINSNSNNNNNNSNNTFNLQVFLNETCKNAMNFSDFVKGIQTDLTDVEYVGKNGYVNGISNILIKNISKLKVEERPLHCTDQRRETIYIKENDVWEKEDLTDENNKMIQLVRDVSVMNAKNVHVWRDNYPQCLTAYSDKTDQYNYIVHEALGGDTKYTTKQKEEKIITKILKSILIDKK